MAEVVAREVVEEDAAGTARVEMARVSAVEGMATATMAAVAAAAREACLAEVAREVADVRAAVEARGAAGDPVGEGAVDSAVADRVEVGEREVASAAAEEHLVAAEAEEVGPVGKRQGRCIHKEFV